jgi:hypothetical protein
MMLQPAGAPNHAVWTLGHIIYSCQALAVELGAESWLPADWEAHFAYGSTPNSIKPDIFTISSLLADLELAGNRLRTVLLALNEGAIGNAFPDQDKQEILPTLGHVLLQVVAAHTAFHAGQLASWRRAIGRKPVGIFI